MSHFSFTRGSSDDCALKQHEQESTGPFVWTTDKEVVEPAEQCFVGASPFMHNPLKTVPQSFIDVESELRGQTRNLSKCSSHKYLPQNEKPLRMPVTDCKDPSLVPEYTRLQRPCNTLSGVSINRFYPLQEDVQDLRKIQSNDLAGINTRLLAKDGYKKK